MKIHPGLRVGNHRCLDCWPCFQLEPGHSGTIVTADPDFIAVHMDTHMDGAEQWNNEFHLTSEDLGFEYPDGKTFTKLEELFFYFFQGD